MRIVKRETLKPVRAWSVRILSLLFGMAVCGLLIYAITGLNPVSVYVSMAKGAFGSSHKMWQTFRDTAFLLCISLGLAPAFKMRFWNIGAEGQVLAGGIATAACMIYFKNMSAPMLMIVMLLSAIAAGALWGFLPAIFKAKFGTNETLFTLMMNYVAIQLTSYCVSLWETPYGSNTVGIINMFTKAGWMPEVFGQQYALNIIIVLGLSLAMFLYLKYTRHGYEIAVVGQSLNTARYAGINISKVVIRTMLLSGALCGFAGYLAVAGSSHTISTSTSGGAGFTAIIVAWLSKFNAFVMILVSLLLVFFDKGAVQIATDFGLNAYASKMIIGIILFFILGSEFFINYKFVINKKVKKGEVQL